MLSQLAEPRAVHMQICSHLLQHCGRCLRPYQTVRSGKLSSGHLRWRERTGSSSVLFHYRSAGTDQRCSRRWLSRSSTYANMFPSASTLRSMPSSLPNGSASVEPTPRWPVVGTLMGGHNTQNKNRTHNSLTHSLIHSLNHSLTHSLTHSLIHSFTHSLTHSLIHARTHSLTHTHTHSLTHTDSLTHTHSLTLTHSHSHSLTHTHSLTHCT